MQVIAAMTLERAIALPSPCCGRTARKGACLASGFAPWLSARCCHRRPPFADPD